MSSNGFQERYVEDLGMLLAAAETSGKAFAGYAETATSPELKKMLGDGKEEGEQQIDALRELLRGAGAQAEGTANPVVDTMMATGRKRVDSASGPVLTDLAVIDALRVTLHYYIAAYDMVAIMARNLGLSGEAGGVTAMRGHMDEKDRDYGRLAATMAGTQGVNAGQ